MCNSQTATLYEIKKDDFLRFQGQNAAWQPIIEQALEKKRKIKKRMDNRNGVREKFKLEEQSLEREMSKERQDESLQECSQMSANVSMIIDMDYPRA